MDKYIINATEGTIYNYLSNNITFFYHVLKE